MPLHPLLTHFPIAGILMGFVLSLVAVLWKKDEYGSAAMVVFWISAVAAVAAAITGTADAESVKVIPGIEEALSRHSTLGNATAWVIVSMAFLSLYLKLKGQLANWLFLTMLLILTILVITTGYYGGELVFLHGAGVK